MKCPCCGAKGKNLVKVCRSCGEAFASQDLLELNQLEYLVSETATWSEVADKRSHYVQHLENLRERLERFKPTEPAEVAEEKPVITPETKAPEPPRPESKPAPAATAPAKVAEPIRTAPAPSPKPAAKPKPAAPPREKVPFDQWLLSERNIKLALYSGGLLLVIAGIIFIGVNWTRIPGTAGPN